ncbi:hypothetical protein [Streptomyces sp. NPDC014006]|uniref:hypothetical protein n=1 Tax=Streptomyces sp. NPDC014006 TaxID=3364870 RepID=UPI0037024931
MKPFLPVALLTGALLVTVVLTGCAGSTTGTESTGASQRTANDAGTAPSGCPSGSSLPWPANFPSNVPVPEGAAVTSVEQRSGDRLIVSTVVRGGFDATLTFLQKELPAAGFSLKEGEVENDDAESNFSSSTVEGRWTLREIPGCEGGAYLTYLTSTTT